jgi:hypothetical protein
VNLRDYRPAGGWLLLAVALVALMVIGTGSVIVYRYQIQPATVITPAPLITTPAAGKGGPGPKTSSVPPRTPLQASPRIPGVTAPPTSTRIYSVTNSPPPVIIHHHASVTPPVTSSSGTLPSVTTTHAATPTSAPSPEPSPDLTPAAPDTTGQAAGSTTPPPGGWGGITSFYAAGTPSASASVAPSPAESASSSLLTSADAPTEPGPAATSAAISSGSGPAAGPPGSSATGSP